MINFTASNAVLPKTRAKLIALMQLAFPCLWQNSVGNGEIDHGRLCRPQVVAIGSSEVSGDCSCAL